MLDRTPRTMRNMEIAGLLTPIKLNSRATVYKLSEVEALQQGKAFKPVGLPFAKVRTLPC